MKFIENMSLDLARMKYNLHGKRRTKMSEANCSESDAAKRSVFDRFVMCGTDGRIRTYTERNLNPLPLPIGLRQHLKLVWMAGFEPATARFQSDYSTKLSYIQINRHKKAPHIARLLNKLKLHVHKKASEIIGGIGRAIVKINVFMAGSITAFSADANT